MTPSPNVLILYTRLPDYFLHGLKVLAQRFDLKVCIVSHPQNALSPYRHDLPEAITQIQRDEVQIETLTRMVGHQDLQLVYVAGWTDKGYLTIAREARKKGIPVVCGMDNQWYGNIRQHIATRIGRWHLHRYFSHLWIPGPRQYEFGRRLGFPHRNILWGLYCANLDVYQSQSASPESEMREFWFVGRLVKEKGIDTLISAIRILKQKTQVPFKVNVAGIGPMEEKLALIPEVILKGFLQPAELAHEIGPGGIFVLPSHYEPWGVVVHEFAAMGFPIITTTEVGASDAFVKPWYNGAIVAPNNPEQLAGAMSQQLLLPEEEFARQSDNSRQLAATITPESWASTLYSVLIQATRPI